MASQSSCPRMVDALGAQPALRGRPTAAAAPSAYLKPTAAGASDDKADAPARINAALRGLIDNLVLATSIEGLARPEALAKAAARAEALLNAAESASSIYRAVQPPFFEAAHDPAKLAWLQRAGLRPELQIDGLFAPFASPWADFTRALDAAWEPGIRRLCIGRKRLPFGLLRGWTPGSSAEPHQDVLRRETSLAGIGERIRCQIGVNLHLTDALGGDMQVWDRRVSDAEWADHGPPGSYGYSRAELGEPDLVLHAGAATITLVNTANVHAVAQVLAGMRLTISGFIAYLGDDEPLECWS